MSGSAQEHAPLDRRHIGRRALLLMLGLGLALPKFARADDDITVPVALQVQLLAKVISYDRNFAARSRDGVRVLIVASPRSAESRRSAEMLRAALSDLPSLGGRPHEDQVIAYEGAAALARSTEHAAVVYLTPGLGDEIEAIAASLDGHDILSVSAVGAHVPRGVVLGFDLSAGSPKLLAHLVQARKQHVAFDPLVLKLMRVYP